jgi:hypothetical protein
MVFHAIALKNRPLYITPKENEAKMKNSENFKTLWW